MELREVAEADYAYVMRVIDSWWGGRPMAAMLPKLFFVHFRDTSFVLEEAGEIVAFLIGFVSQTFPNEAYIHFVGVHPEYRSMRLGNRLYETFFQRVQARGCDTVRCVTSPVNQGSVAFHTRMGFAIEKVAEEYDGQGQSRVLFVKKIGETTAV
ncbi:acetyltransferase (GNAT) family protein [Tumebacillus sp. BK434]|uniref:GNAT family N-acetyltransferase n=1 Tax=Tumebacillus sp. BK434 TaxID=2512169 RepID=UPI001048F928|nr:GNAT family N-acetyltransferase [Tumebacillus sp. BK434]TCP59326.1 acetyltransferase (GNAT) family protein [Tumebacillus sp. BK434]